MNDKLLNRLKRPVFVLTLVVIMLFSFSSNIKSDSTEPNSINSISAMTYNIRFDIPEDKLFDWEERKIKISQTISSNKPDIIGIQGAYYNQVRWLEEELEIYDWYAIGSEDGQFRGEHCAIFYNKTNFKLLDSGTHWLPNSSNQTNNNNMASSSVLTWVKLQLEENDNLVYIFNTRLRGKGDSRIKVIQSILDQISEIAGDNSFILTGDFNSEPNDDSIKLITTICKEAKENSFIQSATVDFTYINSINGNVIQRRQDYVFFSESFPINTYEVINNNYNEKYPSDHLPVICKLKFP